MALLQVELLSTDGVKSFHSFDVPDLVGYRTPLACARLFERAVRERFPEVSSLTSPVQHGVSRPKFLAMVTDASPFEVVAKPLEQGRWQLQVTA